MASRKLFTFAQLIQPVSSLQPVIDQCTAAVAVPVFGLQKLSDIIKISLDGPFIYSVLLCFFCFRDQYTFQRPNTLWILLAFSFFIGRSILFCQFSLRDIISLF